MNTLYLTADEEELFDALPDTLKEGWKTEKQEIEYVENPEELYLRYKIARFTDPMLEAFVLAVREAKNVGDFEKAASSVDVSAYSQEQLAELFFVLGVGVMSAMVVYVLKNAANDEDLEGIATMTDIRRMLMESNISV